MIKMDEEFEPQPDVVKKQGFLKRLSFSGQLERFTIYLLAGIPAIVLIVVAILAFVGVFSPLRFSMGEKEMIFGAWYDFLVIAVLVATGVFGIYEFFRLRRIRRIDNRFPDFVRDLAESRRAGMTFTKSNNVFIKR